MEIIKEGKSDLLNSPKSAGIISTQYLTFAEPPDEFKLENGEKLGPITIAFETYGRLNDDKNNAILVFHALSGDAHAAGYNSSEDKKPGWWDMMIGPAKPFDTNKYFVICSNILGGCKGTTGPYSINPETSAPYALSFPDITIKDMITVQKYLIDYLGIEKLFCVAGGSMGGMLALQWIVSYPDSAKGAVLIATAASHTAQEIAFNSIGRYSIISDPDWNCGNYYGGLRPETGLSIARMIGHVTYISEEAMHNKFGRNISNSNLNDSSRYSGCNETADFMREFEVESYLKYQGESFIKRFDANSYLYITRAIDNFDITEGFENLADALSGVKSKCFVISFTSDWLYPKEQSQKIVKALKINGIETIYTNFDSPYGHDAFLIEDERLKKIVTGFLMSIDQ